MKINLEDMQKFKDNQRSELFESIRHFSKYIAVSNLNPELSVPDSATCVEESLIKLYEEHYENE